MPARLGTRLGPRFATLDRQVELKFVEVAGAIGVATDKLIGVGDVRPMPRVGPADEVSGELHRMVDRLIEEQLARFPTMGSEFRYLVTLLRVVPELERSAELVDLVADRAGLAAPLAAQVRDDFAEMGRLSSSMWGEAGTAWVEMDGDAVSRLDERDDDMDLMVSGLSAMLTAEGVATRTAIELTLVGRFYERLGDHAVHIARRIKWLADGT